LTASSHTVSYSVYAPTGPARYRLSFPTRRSSDLSGVATLNGVSLAGIDAGTYAAVGASFAGDSGYDPSNGTGTLTVNKASLQITDRNNTRLNSSHAETVNAGYSGIINSEDHNALT